MRKDKHLAIQMRKEGKSYSDILTALKVSKGTLSNWLGREVWSREVRAKLIASAGKRSTLRLVELNKKRGANLTKAYEEAREAARKEFELRKYDPLFISGVMLYWGEGAKDPKQGAKFTNSDAKMIKFYVAFLIQSCGIPIEKIKVHLILYPEHEERITRSYWSKMIGLPSENFTKSVILMGRTASRRLGWGVCTITVSSNYFKQQILEWIKLLPEELLLKEYYANISK